MSKQLLSSFRNKQILEEDLRIDFKDIQSKTGYDIRELLEECAKEQRDICARKYAMQHIITVGTKGVREDIKNAEFPNRWFSKRFNPDL